MKDSEFIRGKAPMTKEEVRAITISKLDIKAGDYVLDIGAGTGSVSIEIAYNYPGSNLVALEKDEKRIELIKKNIEKFKLKNIDVLKGFAPNIYNGKKEKFDKIFIGGSSGKIKEIILKSKKLLKNSGKIVLNTITIENLYNGLDSLKKNNFSNIEVIQVAISKGKFVSEVTLMESRNPIFIICGEKR